MSASQSRNMDKPSDDELFENKTKEEIFRRINELRKNIKRKHSSMKREIADTEEQWQRQLKPISDPLKQLLEAPDSLAIKQEEKQAPAIFLKRRGAEDFDIKPRIKRLKRTPSGRDERRDNLFSNLEPSSVDSQSESTTPVHQNTPFFESGGEDAANPNATPNFELICLL